MERGVLAELIRRLEGERSYELCVELAGFLGYGISGEPGSVQVDLPHSPVLSVYFSVDALVEDLISDARRLVGN